MTILTAIDGESGSDAVVRTGHELATAFDEELVVLHVKPETERQGEAEGIGREVFDTLGSAEGVTVVGALGDPEVRILDEADDRDARFIVLGARKRTPIGKALVGSVAQVVMLNSDAPVVTVVQE